MKLVRMYRGKNYLNLLVRFWKRYVDDICDIIEKVEVRSTRNSLNRLYSNMQLTLEMGKEGQILFLGQAARNKILDPVIYIKASDFQHVGPHLSPQTTLYQWHDASIGC